uniref:Uncharacterized protein n=1 Tax=Nicotiana tabacum TaxID=4097 RepID=A0A1S3Y0V7_TOBAC|nr:PREDICTED: uncharacterized protein LOC107771026 [Nicotiana tabacum]
MFTSQFISTARKSNKLRVLPQLLIIASTASASSFFFFWWVSHISTSILFAIFVFVLSKISKAKPQQVDKLQFSRQIVEDKQLSGAAGHREHQTKTAKICS